MTLSMRKRYWAPLALVAIIVLDWFIHAPQWGARSVTGAINEAASPALKNYPYKFWVMRIEGETAVVSTPRNVDVPAAKMLAVLYPNINTKDANDPAFIAVEQELGKVQSEVRGIVLRQPGIKDMRWELDRDWLVSHYIDVPEKRN